MKNKEPTFVTTCRVDLRLAAQLLLFWETKGVTITSRNQLIEQSLYALADMITASDKNSEIESTEFALRILKERGLIKDKLIRNKQTIIKQLSLEDIETEEKGVTRTVLNESEEQEALRIMEGHNDNQEE